jgi:hypothetical protein
VLTTDIKDRINEGTLIINHSGHGSTQLWSEIFTILDVADLTNATMLPFVVSMSCLSGDFSYPEPFLPCLGEELLRSEGTGAVGALMPTGLTATPGQHILNTALFEAILTEDVRTLGDALSAAKQTLLANGDSHSQEVSESFLLLGDPALKLKLPLPRRPTGVTLESTSQGITISWHAAVDCNGDPVAGYNLYRSTSTDGSYEKLNTSLITETTFTDTTGETGITYYYRVRSVDSDGDQSVTTPTLSALAAAIGRGSGKPSSTGGGCFIATVGGGN